MSKHLFYFFCCCFALHISYFKTVLTINTMAAMIRWSFCTLAVVKSQSQNDHENAFISLFGVRKQAWNIGTYESGWKCLIFWWNISAFNILWQKLLIAQAVKKWNTVCSVFALPFYWFFFWIQFLFVFFSLAIFFFSPFIP